jgi:uncharacterized protein (TIRG00374 family)
MGINFLAGIIISAVLLLLAFHNIDFQSVLNELKNIDLLYAVPVVAVCALVQYLRSYRWGLLLQPLLSPQDDRLGQKTLFPVTSVGFLAIMALPARVGELVRPYLISGRTGVRMPSALATIVVERIFDVITVLVMFLLLLCFFPMPGWLARSGLVWAAVTVAAVAVLVPPVRQKLLGLAGKFPARLKFLAKWIGQFDSSLTACTRSGNLIPFVLLSILIWMLNALTFYLLFPAFGFDVPVQAAFVVMIVIIIGIAVPSAPGFIGNWHFACLAALAVFGVPRVQALSYAIVSHFLSTSTLAVLGLLFLPACNVNIMEDLGRMKNLLKAEESRPENRP